MNKFDQLTNMLLNEYFPMEVGAGWDDKETAARDAIESLDSSQKETLMKLTGVEDEDSLINSIVKFAEEFVKEDRLLNSISNAKGFVDSEIARQKIGAILGGKVLKTSSFGALRNLYKLLQAGQKPLFKVVSDAISKAVVAAAPEGQTSSEGDSAPEAPKVRAPRPKKQEKLTTIKDKLDDEQLDIWHKVHSVEGGVSEQDLEQIAPTDEMKKDVRILMNHGYLVNRDGKIIAQNPEEESSDEKEVPALDVMDSDEDVDVMGIDPDVADAIREMERERQFSFGDYE